MKTTIRRIPGIQKLSVQSQSFPDLTRKSDMKIEPYTKTKLNQFYGANKSSKLPVASR